MHKIASREFGEMELELVAAVAKCASVQTKGSRSGIGKLEPAATVKKFLAVRQEDSA